MHANFYNWCLWKHHFACTLTYRQMCWFLSDLTPYRHTWLLVPYLHSPGIQRVCPGNWRENQQHLHRWLTLLDDKSSLVVQRHGGCQLIELHVISANKTKMKTQHFDRQADTNTVIAEQRVTNNNITCLSVPDYICKTLLKLFTFIFTIAYAKTHFLQPAN